MWHYLIEIMSCSVKTELIIEKLFILFCKKNNLKFIIILFFFFVKIVMNTAKMVKINHDLT